MTAAGGDQDRQAARKEQQRDDDEDRAGLPIDRRDRQGSKNPAKPPQGQRHEMPSRAQYLPEVVAVCEHSLAPLRRQQWTDQTSFAKPRMNDANYKGDDRRCQKGDADHWLLHAYGCVCCWIGHDLASVNTVTYGATMSKRLGKQEWIEAALRSLAEHGVDAVRVERLAEALQVTKGSFYWHFQDRDALLSAMLEAWQARATNDIIAMVEARGGETGARIRALGLTVFNADGRLDRQVRAWAANDEQARAAQVKIDQRRLGYLEQLFKELGFSTAQANARATFSYHALIGQFAMNAKGKPKPGQLEIIFELLMRK